MLGTLVIGGGPGGTGALVWAAQHGRLDEWLRHGVTVVERAPTIGGTIGRYAVNSDSLGAVYLELLDSPYGRELFAPLRGIAETLAIEAEAGGYPALKKVDAYFRRLGEILAAQLRVADVDGFLPGIEVTALKLRPDGTVRVEAMAGGTSVTLAARSVVMALGGKQDATLARSAVLMPGVALADLDADKIMPSNIALTEEGLARARRMVQGGGTVVILGGSHSAFSTAWALLNRDPEIPFAPGAITIASRRLPKIFYADRAAATLDGWPTADDEICRRTGRVNRLGGLRGDGREMWRAVMARPGIVPEPRVTLMPLAGDGSDAALLRRRLEAAALVVPCFGYSSTSLPVFDANGRRLALNADLGGVAVDQEARWLLADGGVLDNVFGIGLGSGYRPTGPMGGEPGFRGQANSLWLFQNDIGALVHDGCRRAIESGPTQVGYQRMSA